MKFKFMDPETIMAVIVCLIILAVGIFAFFITIQNIPVSEPGHETTKTQNSTYSAIENATTTANSVFDIVGVVLIIGAIMTIVGLVYSYVKPRY